MIRVNLLPESARPRSSLSAASLAALPWRSIGIGVVSFFVFYSAWLAFSNWNQARSLAQLTAQWEGIAAERSHFQKTQASLAALQNRTAVVKSLKAEEVQWAPRLNLLSDSLVGKLWFTELQFFPQGMPEQPAGTSQSKKGKARSAKAPVSKKKPGEKKSGKKKSAAGQEAKAHSPSKVQEPPKKIPAVVLKGSTLVMTAATGSPVSRYLQRLKDHPEFKRFFSGLELKSVEHRQIQQEDVSDFVIVLYPKGL